MAFFRSFDTIAVANSTPEFHYTLHLKQFEVCNQTQHGHGNSWTSLFLILFTRTVDGVKSLNSGSPNLIPEFPSRCTIFRLGQTAPRFMFHIQYRHSNWKEFKESVNQIQKKPLEYTWIHYVEIQEIDHFVTLSSLWWSFTTRSAVVVFQKTRTLSWGLWASRPTIWCCYQKHPMRKKLHLEIMPSFSPQKSKTYPCFVIFVGQTA